MAQGVTTKNFFNGRSLTVYTIISILRTPVILAILCLVGSVVEGCSSSSDVGEYRVIR
jgi:hypothetical protein